MESGRLAMLLAVLEQSRAGEVDERRRVRERRRRPPRHRARGSISRWRSRSPGAQLGAAVTRDTVAIGELGLGGEVRSVPQLERRLAEAARLGFTRAVVPKSPHGVPQAAGLELVEVTDVRHAVDAALIPAG